MRFGIIKSDEKVFVGDKINFDFSKSFVTPEEVLATVNHEASFDAGLTWINVTASKNIDYVFVSAGTKTVSLRITTQSGNSVFTKQVAALDLTAQQLFSTDSDLYRFEPEIDKLLPKKWTSWNLVHLEAQKYFIDWLDEKRIFNEQKEKYTVADLTDRDQVRQFSIFKTLELIYSGTFNQTGDIYSTKRDKYRELANEKLAKSTLSLDYNKNGTADEGERTDLHSVGVIRG